MLLCAGFALTTLRRRPYLVTLGVIVVAFSLGALDAYARADRAGAFEAEVVGAPRCRFTLTALESEGGLGMLAAVDDLACDDSSAAPRGLVWLDRTAVPRATFAGEGWLVPLGADGFGDARRRFGAGAEIVVIHARAIPPEEGLAGLAHDIRTGLERATERMEPDRAALLAGVTTGDTSAMPESTSDLFRAAGLSHLVAVSGQNVAMVLGAVAVVTHALGARARIILALSAVGLFVVVVGPQPSVLRAAAMAMIALTGLGLGVRADPWHLLALALAVIVALRPAVLYSAGLHLSAAATAGLLLWARSLSARLTRLPPWIALGLAATLAAQFAVTPIVAGLFGSISLVAPIANVLALPAVPPATVLGLCAAVAGALDPGIGRALAVAAEPFVAWILLVARWLGAGHWSALEVPSWVAWPLGAVVLGVAVGTAAAVRAPKLRSYG